MTEQNQLLFELVRVVKDVCDKERSIARGGLIDHGLAGKFRNMFVEMFPELAKDFLDAPDIIYVRRVITAVVQGLGDKVYTAVWEDYFEGGRTLASVAARVDLSTRTVKRYIASFAERIVGHLWEMAEEDIARPVVVSQTVEQRAKQILDEEFGVRGRPADALLEFCKEENPVSRAVIAARLFIAPDTLKQHIRRIVRNKKMRAATMNDAAKKARKVLKSSLGDDWERYCGRMS